MLINESYFTGPLTIAQLGEKAVIDRLRDFINRYEPLILEAALGYDFYQAFLEGLDVSSDEVIEQRWLDLLNGVAFANYGVYRKRWVGFAGGQNSQTLVASQRDDLFIYAGVTPGFAQGGYSYTDSSLQGWNFTLEIFGAGTFQPVTEWNYKSGGGITLTDTNYKTNYDERWVIHFTGRKVGIVSSGQNLISPLAGFIYYEFVKDWHTQNTGIGIVKSKGENSEVADPSRKLVDAFNQAVRDINILWEFLQTDSYKTIKVYPEFLPQQIDGIFGYYGYNGLYSFRPINVFGI